VVGNQQAGGLVVAAGVRAGLEHRGHHGGERLGRGLGQQCGAVKRRHAVRAARAVGQAFGTILGLAARHDQQGWRATREREVRLRWHRGSGARALWRRRRSRDVLSRENEQRGQATQESIECVVRCVCAGCIGRRRSGRGRGRGRYHSVAKKERVRGSSGGEKSSSQKAMEEERMAQRRRPRSGFVRSGRRLRGSFES